MVWSPTIWQWYGTPLHRADYGDWPNNIARSGLCCCRFDCCCFNWPDTNNYLVATISGDISGTMNLPRTTQIGYCQVFAGDKQFSWSCASGVPNIILSLTVRCDDPSNLPSQVQVSASIAPSNPCNNFPSAYQTDPAATCYPFRANFHFDYSSPSPSCLCSYGIDVSLEEVYV